MGRKSAFDKFLRNIYSHVLLVHLFFKMATRGFFWIGLLVFKGSNGTISKNFYENPLFLWYDYRCCYQPRLNLSAFRLIMGIFLISQILFCVILREVFFQSPFSRYFTTFLESRQYYWHTLWMIYWLEETYFWFEIIVW